MGERGSRFNPGYEYLEVPEIRALDQLELEWWSLFDFSTLGPAEKAVRREQILKGISQGLENLYERYRGEAENLRLLIRFVRFRIMRYDSGGVSMGRDRMASIFEGFNKRLFNSHFDLIQEADEEQARLQGLT